MKKTNKRTIPHRRKREQKTNYYKRLELLKSQNLRLVVRKSTSYIRIQIVKYQPKGDQILASADSKDLLKQGFKGGCKSIPAAYITGLMLAKKAKEAKIDSAILDLGFNNTLPGTKIFAAVKGALDGGLKIPVSGNVFPSEERLMGEHIANFLNTEKLPEKQFAKNKDSADNYKKMIKTLVEKFK